MTSVVTAGDDLDGTVAERRIFVGYDAAESDSVPAVWRWTPLLLYPLLMVFALAAAFGVGVTTQRFAPWCPLYAELEISDFDGHNVTLVENTESRWGSPTACDFTMFTPVFSVIFIVAWFFFFCMCGSGGKGSSEGFGMDRPWRIVFPGLVFHFAMMVVSLVSAVWTSDGINVFCRNLKESCDGLFDCEYMDRYVFTDYPHVKNLNSWFILATTSAWLLFAGFLALTLLLAFRCLCRPDLTPIFMRTPASLQPVLRASAGSTYMAVGERQETKASVSGACAELRRANSADSFLSAGSSQPGAVWDDAAERLVVQPQQSAIAAPSDGAQ